MSELISKKFENLDVTVYGTYDKPLFKASDIGDLLGISRIRDTVSKLDNNCVVKSTAGITGGIISAGNPNTWFLTEKRIRHFLKNFNNFIFDS